ncbi:MAG: glycosyltransferase [Candidatus Nanopelagicales bacterium]
MPEFTLVSVIIPVYNRADMLAASIDSVLAQDYPNVELLVIDDGSTDQTPEVIAGYGERIRAFRHDNRGQAATVNRGFELAQGEWYSVLGSDDQLYPAAVRSAIDTAQQQPDTVAIHGIVEVVDDSGKLLHTHSTPNLQLLEFVRWHCGPASTGVLYRADAVARVGGWNSAYPFGLDWEYWLRIGLQGPYAFTDTVVGNFVQHAGSITAARADDRALAEEWLRAVEEFVDRADLPVQFTPDRVRESLRCAYYGAGAIIGGELNRPGERYEMSFDHVARAIIAAPGARFPFIPEETGDRRTPTRAPDPDPAITVPATGPLVSVITPTFNRRHFLQETLDSVLGQDYPLLEHLVLDDGSTDDTAELLAEYQQRYPDRLRVFRHENMGQVRTVNRGFAQAQGELLMVVNSDDLLLPGAISALVQAWLDDPEAIAVYSDFRVIDAEGAPKVDILAPELDFLTAFRWQSDIGAGVMYTRRMVEALGGWNPEYRTMPDLEFWTRGYLLGHYRHVPAVLATWRDHDEAITVMDAADHAITERFHFIDEFLARPDIPPEIVASRAEALRSLHIIAAQRVLTENGRPQDRFVILDRLGWQTDSRAAGHTVAHKLLAEQEHSARLAVLAEARTREVASAMEQLQALDATCRQAHATITERDLALNEAARELGSARHATADLTEQMQTMQQIVTDLRSEVATAHQTIAELERNAIPQQTPEQTNGSRPWRLRTRFGPDRNSNPPSGQRHG